MKVRITKSGKKTYWYSNRIGEEFEIRDTGEQVYYVEYKGVERGVDKEDCEVIPDEAETPFIGSEDKLFQAAVAAMQGMVANSRIASTDTLLVEYSWDLAEALINEGKKRGHL